MCWPSRSVSICRWADSRDLGPELSCKGLAQGPRFGSWVLVKKKGAGGVVKPGGAPPWAKPLRKFFFPIFKTCLKNYTCRRKWGQFLSLNRFFPHLPWKENCFYLIIGRRYDKESNSRRVYTFFWLPGRRVWRGSGQSTMDLRFLGYRGHVLGGIRIRRFLCGGSFNHGQFFPGHVHRRHGSRPARNDIF